MIASHYKNPISLCGLGLFFFQQRVQLYTKIVDSCFRNIQCYSPPSDSNMSIQFSTFDFTLHFFPSKPTQIRNQFNAVYARELKSSRALPSLTWT